jgi:HEAT repeat protein
MADVVRQMIERLGELRSQIPTSDSAGEVRRAVGHGSSHLVAKAAQIAELHALKELIPDLEKAFFRFVENEPEKTDKGCTAKNAIVSALRAVNAPGAEVYLRGVRHIQMEASCGPPVDTAPELRGNCALGLIDVGHPEAMHEVIRLLVDHERPARIGAVRALGSSGKPEAALLLRLKALIGDREPEVTGEALAELLRLDPRGEFDFVAGFLHADTKTAEGAALALGQTRQERAFKLLRDKWNSTSSSDLSQTLLLAIGILRLEESVDFLVETLARGHPAAARGALAALALYRCEARVGEVVSRAVAQRKDRQLDEEFARLWI